MSRDASATLNWIEGQIESLERLIDARGDGGSKEQRAALARMRTARANAQANGAAPKKCKKNRKS